MVKDRMPQDAEERQPIDIDEFLDLDSGIEKDWYVIHTYSGYENKVKANLERQVEWMGMEDEIFRVVVPIEEEIEGKDGEKKITRKKVFPGYGLVGMVMSVDSWYVVRNTAGVTGY